MRALLLALLIGCGSSASTPVAPMPAGSPPSFPATCNAIARDIEVLADFPQLDDFRAADQHDCHVSYSYRTKPPSGRGGGYSAGIPRPEPDGIFLYIGIWDPNAPNNRQLDTQPVSMYKLGDRRVTLIVSQGAQTKNAFPAILEILKRHGMTEG